MNTRPPPIDWELVKQQFDQIDTFRRLNNLFKTLDAKCYNRDDVNTLDKFYELSRRRIQAQEQKP